MGERKAETSGVLGTVTGRWAFGGRCDMISTTLSQETSTDQKRPRAEVPDIEKRPSADVTPYPVTLIPGRSATADERDAILSSLYERLGELNERRRRGDLDAHGLASLTDVKTEIDRWERVERVAAGKSEIVERLEALTERVLRVVGTGEKL